MTPDAYRAAIARLGLSQEKAGDWIASKRSGRRWAIEGPPRSVAMVLEAAIKLHDDGWSWDEIEELFEASDVVKPLVG